MILYYYNCRHKENILVHSYESSETIIMKKDILNLRYKVLINSYNMKNYEYTRFLNFLRKFDFHKSSQNPYNLSILWYTNIILFVNLYDPPLIIEQLIWSYYSIILFCYNCTQVQRPQTKDLKTPHIVLESSIFFLYTGFPKNFQTCFNFYHVKLPSSPPTHTLRAMFYKLSCTLATFRKF